MSNTYEEQRVVAAEDGTRVETTVTLTLGLSDLLREAREASRLGVRELERRSGVSAGQISRIELGKVERPSRTTLTALAEALGRFPEPLLYLAGHIDHEYLRQAAESVYQKIYDAGFTMETADALDGPGEISVIIYMLWDMPVGLRKLADELIGSGSESVGGAQEIVAAWPGLGEERRRLVRAFVDDQLTLSRIEQSQPGSASRYAISIELTERSDA